MVKYNLTTEGWKMINLMIEAIRSHLPKDIRISADLRGFEDCGRITLYIAHGGTKNLDMNLDFGMITRGASYIARYIEAAVDIESIAADSIN